MAPTASTRKLRWGIAVPWIVAALILCLAAVTHGRDRDNLDSQWRGEARVHIFHYEGEFGEILLPAFADGVDVGPCKLDSGAEPKAMMITPSAAQQAALKPYRWPPWTIVRGSYGKTALLANKTAKEFQVGPVVLSRPRIVSLADLGKVAGDSNRPIASVCSAAILHAAVLDIDRQKKRVTVYKPGEAPADADTLRWLPLEIIKGKPHVRARVNDAHDGLFLIDTGMNSFIAFDRHAVQEMDLLADGSGHDAVITATSTGIGGTGTGRLRLLHSLQLGQYEFRPIPAFLDDKRRAIGNEAIAGRIGTRLLRNFRTILDLPGKRVAFALYQPPPEPRLENQPSVSELP